MIDQQEKKKQLNTITAAVIKIIDSYPVGYKFYGNQLKDDCVKLVPDVKDSYVDTFLKMARRHRRDSYISIDRNNSLYERVKSNFEIEQEKIEQERTEELARIEEDKRLRKTEQINLPFSQSFFAFFFVVFLGTVFVLESGYGRPLFPPSLMASQSSSLYIPDDPMYVYGFLPNLWSLLLTAAVDTDFPIFINRSDITKTVKGISIPLIIYRKNSINQAVIAQLSINKDTYLYNCIVNRQYILKNSFQKLDNLLWQNYYNYILYMSMYLDI